MPGALKSQKDDVGREVFFLISKLAQLSALVFLGPERCTDENHTVLYVHEFKKLQKVNELGKLVEEYIVLVGQMLANSMHFSLGLDRSNTHSLPELYISYRFII